MKFFIFIFFGFSFVLFSNQSLAQENSSPIEKPIVVKTFNLDATTDSVTQIGDMDFNSSTNSLRSSNDSFPVSGYWYIAFIVGAILTTLIFSLEKRKQVEFQKWNLEHREKMRGNKK